MSTLPTGTLPSPPPALAPGPAVATAAPRSWARALAPYWLCQAGGWGGYWLVNGWAAVTYDGVAWGRAALDDALLALLGIGLSHALRRHIRRHNWQRLSIAARIARALAASAALGLGAGLVNLALGLTPWQADLPALGLPALAPGLRAAVLIANWATLFLVWTTLYLGVLGVRARHAAERRSAELAQALQAAELRFLKSQLNPHFLFNALNAVRALIADEPARAQGAVTQLARILRYALTSGQRDLVTLDEELAITDDYLALEALRLGERLRIERRIAPEARGLALPVMVLQFLVENAVKHGIAELPDGGTLRIEARQAGDALVLEVENPRPATPRESEHESVGIANARTRLELLFGAGATLTLDLADPARALARVRVPLAPCAR
ncbi:MAG: histidine kinase [Proteobacteria bacterium]|nr:histidine kinase [Pseudomonadota bacterium]